MSGNDYQSPYTPNTDHDRQQMLEAIGVSSVEELFKDIPEGYTTDSLDLPPALSEPELMAYAQELAASNMVPGDYACFLGAGVYRHHIPAVVRQITGRSEFMTAYTPYQPEVSQGTLQTAYEFQTLISQLTGMEVANLGMYDGSTSMAEAALMAARITKFDRISIMDTVSPLYREVLDTYAQAPGLKIDTFTSSQTELEEGTACLIVQQPNFFGYMEDMTALSKLAHDNGALLIFDEVITGFRVGPNSAQGLYRIAPDITTMGKIIGGGLPVGAYGGRKDVMGMVAPLGAMYQAGTLSGNPLAVSAGIATLAELQKPGAFERLDSLAQRLTDGLTKAFQAVEIPSTINRVGSMFTGFFNPGPVEGLANAEGSDTEMYGRYFHAMQEQGVYIAPSQFEAGFVSTAHTEADIDATIAKAEAALSSLR